MRGAGLLVAAAVVTAGVASAQTLAPATSGVVPVVSRTPGAMDSMWSTNVYLTQVTGSSPATVTLKFYATDWVTSTVEVAVPGAGGSAEVVDVVTAAGLPDGSYVMTWWSTQPVVLSTRTFTTGASGSYGQGIGSVAVGSGFRQGGTVIFPAPMGAGDHRVNLGIANAGSETQSFHLEAVDAAGSVVSTWDQEVGPHEVAQLRTNAGMHGVGSVTLRCDAGCDGSAYGYASVVVNDSNDAYFMYAGAGEGTVQYAPVMTVRNDEGVWFITGGSLYDVFEAMGYAVATDRLWQMETYRRAARGTLAEIFGVDYLSQDVLARATGYSDGELEQVFEDLDGDSKAVVQGYADGVNRRIAEVVADQTLLPFEFKAVGAQLGRPFGPAPWTTADIMSWVALMQRSFDPEALEMGQVENGLLLQALSAAYPSEVQAMLSDLRWLNDPAAQTMIPSSTPKRVRELPTPDPSSFPDLRLAAQRLRARLTDRVEKLDRINARVRMGSYAWVISGDRTATGNPILYSGPQMGFPVPSIVLEGSIRGGGLAVSGMTTPGIPGIIIGRTPHHAWSMQVGHAHTLDYYFEIATNVELHRHETIRVAGMADQVVPIYRSPRGPIVEPLPYDPDDPPLVILSWAYAHWGREALPEFVLGSARAQSMDDFARAIDTLGVSQHFCYADADGNIAYWMSGWDPIRPSGVDPRFPLLGTGSQDWTGEYRTRAHDRNTDQGYYGGWNNKAAADYDNPPQSVGYQLGPAHRAHVIEEYLSTHQGLSFEEVRNLALRIATTDSFGGGGNTWSFVAADFRAAVLADPTPDREQALALIEAWDGHFVAGGPEEWVAGTLRDDAWVLQDAWIREVLRLVFSDEFAGAELAWDDQPLAVLFNVLLHALAGDQASLPTQYDWFRDRSGSGLPTTAAGLIVVALDNVLADLGPRPWNVERGVIAYRHDLLGVVHTTPRSSRSTYAQVVELGDEGPLRIESMFPLGESGTILMDGQGNPVFDDDFYSMTSSYDGFEPRPFPLFE